MKVSVAEESISESSNSYKNNILPRKQDNGGCDNDRGLGMGRKGV